MKNIFITITTIITAVVLFSSYTANAHRSGCHRWHSCPSDRGTYVCGDKGYCSQCPDNKYCKDGKPRNTKEQVPGKQLKKQDQRVRAAEKSTYELVLAAKSCKTWNQTISCEYTVGSGLKFSIDGIGQPDTGITFIKSSFDGDFYATFGTLHGCVVIKRGPKGTTSSAIRGPGSFTDYAFVSPKNGKVYQYEK